jgi:hypothetical protein
MTTTADAVGTVSGYRVILSWDGYGPALVFPSGVSGEILHEVSPVPIPHATAGIAGVVGVQGRVLPVLELPDPPGATGNGRLQVLIVRDGAEAIALRTRARPGFTAVTGALDAPVRDPVPTELHDGAGEMLAIAGEPSRGWSWSPVQWARARVARLSRVTTQNASASGNIR